VSARGFTLLEVLIALTILGVAVVASIQGFAQGLRLLKLSGDHQTAMLLADQKMREAIAPVEGREEGTESRFQWVRTVERVPTPELADSVRAARARVYEIDVRVRWDERREVQLTTLRTIPNADAAARAGAPSLPPTPPASPNPPGGSPVPTNP
jgi:type II secretion system protein I